MRERVGENKKEEIEMTSQSSRERVKKKKKSLRGYLTLEAAMVFPIVFALVIMLLYLTFYLYDRCRMTQDLYTAAYRVSIQRGKGSRENEGVDTSGYFMLNGCAAEVSGGREAVATASGVMAPALMTGTDAEGWNLSVSMKARKTDPPFSFRRYRRVMAIAQEALSGKH